MKQRTSVSQLYDRLLKGDRVALGQAVTLVESSLPADAALRMELLEKIQPHTGNSIRIGITGVPGVGKSTFIDAFGCHLTASGKKVAVLAVDPSSRITKGSILGDKTRMPRLAADDHAFIRPSPAGNTTGGVTKRTRETILVCEAAGYDIVIVETVGVGQSETDVHGMTDFFLLLMLAGAGDELQGIKKGIMEMADGIAINKADGDNLAKSNLARAEFSAALHLFQAGESGWIPRVTTCSGLTGAGIPEIRESIMEHDSHMRKSGWFEQRRSAQAVTWMKETFHYLMEENWLSIPGLAAEMEIEAAAVSSGKVSPTVAADRLMKTFLAKNRNL